jgi:hypothetical protein
MSENYNYRTITDKYTGKDIKAHMEKFNPVDENDLISSVFYRSILEYYDKEDKTALMSYADKNGNIAWTDDSQRHNIAGKVMPANTTISNLLWKIEMDSERFQFMYDIMDRPAPSNIDLDGGIVPVVNQDKLGQAIRTIELLGKGIIEQGHKDRLIIDLMDTVLGGKSNNTIEMYFENNNIVWSVEGKKRFTNRGDIINFLCKQGMQLDISQPDQYDNYCIFMTYSEQIINNI